MMGGIDLTIVQALIFAVAVFAYVVMEGFDLGSKRCCAEFGSLFNPVLAQTLS